MAVAARGYGARHEPPTGVSNVAHLQPAPPRRRSRDDRRAAGDPTHRPSDGRCGRPSGMPPASGCSGSATSPASPAPRRRRSRTPPSTAQATMTSITCSMPRRSSRRWTRPSGSSSTAWIAGRSTCWTRRSVAEWGDEERVHDRGWVIQRVFAHDVYHCAELNETLGSRRPSADRPLELKHSGETPGDRPWVAVLVDHHVDVREAVFLERADRPVRLDRRRVPAGASRPGVATVEPCGRLRPAGPCRRCRRRGRGAVRTLERLAEAGGARPSARRAPPPSSRRPSAPTPREAVRPRIPRTPRRGCDGRIAPRSGPARSRRPVLEVWPRPSRPRSLRRRCTDRRPRPWVGAVTPRAEPTLRSASAARRRPAPR